MECPTFIGRKKRLPRSAAVRPLFGRCPLRPTRIMLRARALITVRYRIPSDAVKMQNHATSASSAMDELNQDGYRFALL